MTQLQKIRKASGMSQSELAKKAGISIRTLQALESGARDINKVGLATALKLAHALECDVEDIAEQ